VRWKSLKTLAPSTTSAGLFARSSEGTAVANLQFYVGRGLDAPDDFITLTVAQSQPRSRGSIILRSADPAATPVITANYFADAADLDDLVAGVRLARRIAAASAYRGLIGDAVDPPASTQSDDAMRTWIRGAADTIFHPVGTCRMGRAPEAVVDPELRVRGVERLRVADASIMPVVVNSQTNAACLMIGARVAHLMMEV
jgi:choline dehydrogenase